ncbi:hypothetical protein ACIA8K_08110 [Catenuloplanes sp. NPDC051500]
MIATLEHPGWWLTAGQWDELAGLLAAELRQNAESYRPPKPGR